MKLTPHVETLRTGLANAASLGDDTTQDIARRLGDALDSSARLALIGAITEATDEISTELAPASVEMGLTGDEPRFSIHAPQGAEQPTILTPPDPEQTPTVEHPEGSTESADDESQVRVSLRLPASVKSKVDAAADNEQISTNAWLVHAIQDALAPASTESGAQSGFPPRGGSGGWFGPKGPFGAEGPFGPDGPFGPNGVFGDHGPFAKNPHRHRPGHHGPNPDLKGSHVQGWVR
jgi:hypothetical protein